MKISLIAAIGKNRELGKDNKLLWDIPKDLKRFREITKGHPIIMGRKTFESIGKVLPNRTNIIVSQKLKVRSQNYKSKLESEVPLIANSMEQAIDFARKSEGSEEIFIIGGGQVYKEAIKIAEKLYLTIVDKEFDADTFFPDYSMFKKIVFEEKGEDGGYKYTFLELEKRS